MNKEKRISRGYKKFLLLWSGELVSAIGGGLTSFGLTVYVFAYGLCGMISDQIAQSSGITVGRGSARVIMAAGVGLILLSGILYLSKNVRQLERAEESVQS